MAERVLNTFGNGMVADIDKHLQPEGTYRYSLNGRILFNRGSDGSSGNSFSFQNEKGTILTFNLCSGYSPIQGVETNHGLYIFSGNGTNSEVGVYDLNGDGNYSTLYNDKNDPNGDRLSFQIGAKLFANYVYENEQSQTIYISDGINEDKVFYLNQFYQSAYCDGGCSDFLELRPVHTASCGATQPYPSYMSVHNFQSRSDVIFPKIRFEKRIDGSLKRGAYQYAIRYFNNRHKSTWSMISRHILVTGTHFPDNPEFLTGDTGYSHHNREMDTTNNDAVTEDGLQLKIKGLDTRWSGFEVAYVYSKTDDVSHEANVFYKKNFVCDGEPFPENITIDHVNHTGYPISFDELTQSYETILKTDASREMNNNLVRVGVTLMPELKMDTSKASVSTKTRFIDVDETIQPNFAPVENLRTGRLDGDVLTNTKPTNKDIVLSTFNGNTEVVPIVNDYNSYKGQQVEHLLTGYFRGETYGIGVLVYDRKGKPWFVEHIEDFTLPEQYESDGNLTEYKNNAYCVKIKGLNVDGLRLPKDCLYGSDGKLNVSGFSIVRTERSKNILHQGVVIPVIETAVGAGDSLQRNVQCKPHPYLSNQFNFDYSSQDGGDSTGTDSGGLSHLFSSVKFQRSHWVVREENDEFCDSIDSVSRYCLYYSPDVMIEESHGFIQTRDFLKHVGTCHRAWGLNEIPLYSSTMSQTDRYDNHYYTKSLDTSISRVNGNALYGLHGRPLVSETSRLKFAELIPEYDTELSEFDVDASEMTFKNGVIDTLTPIPGAAFSGNPQFRRSKGVGARNGLLLGMLDFESIDITDSTSTSSYRIMNYMRSKDTYITEDGENSFNVRKYQPTGHYQPINKSVLDSAINEEDAFVFNGIEVWGGDCFVNLFDFTRVVPAGTRNCSRDKTLVDNLGGLFKSNNAIDYINRDRDIEIYPEIGSSMIVPIESKYNIALRFGRHFAKNGTFPQHSYCDNKFEQFNRGIMSLQPESFSINSVLLHQENIQFFSTKPQDFSHKSYRPNSAYISDTKVYSELDDSYRKQKVLNYTDLHGGHGKATGLVRAFNYLYVIQERAYGILRINERALVPTTVGEVLLGTGSGITGIDYISTDNGCQDPLSIVSQNNRIYFWDRLKSQIVMHSQAGRGDLSNAKNVHDYVSVDSLNKDHSIVGGFNVEHGDIFWTINDRTLIFNEDLSKFHGYSSMDGDRYFNYRNKTFGYKAKSPSKVHCLFEGPRGEYFGATYNSKLRFIVNPNPSISKTFDNIKVNVNASGYTFISKVKMITETDEHNLTNTVDGISVDDRFRFRNNSLVFPTREKGKGRLYDHYLEVELEIDNSVLDTEVTITSVETTYRFNRRV